MSKRIRVTQVTVPLEHDTEHVIKKACRISGIRSEDVRHYEIIRRAVDARKKGDLKYSYTVDLITKSGVNVRGDDRRVREVDPVRYSPRADGTEELNDPIAVVGTGPAGLFCALLLARYGYRPLIFERGRTVDERTEDVERFWNGGKIDPDSNVQFGEGGAGTFSDGKLNTQVHDGQGRNRFVLETFVSFGAPKDILFDSQPHIGTDVLRRVVVNIREEILRLGGTFYFSTEVADVEIGTNREKDKQGSLERCGFPEKGLSLSALITRRTDKTASASDENSKVKVSAAVFAIGHSARDTFAMLKNRGIVMEPKPFAVGMRVEHPQSYIDRCQYGSNAGYPGLGPASYKLSYRAGNGRNVYSFCMCPGGYVINASSEEGRTVVNGMSFRARDSKNANSAVIVSVTPEDFPDPDDPLSGIAFQRELEERAFAAGNGKIPQQLFGEFAEDHVNPDKRPDCSAAEPERASFVSCTGGAAVWSDLRGIFPRDVREAFVEGMHAFSKKMAGFDRQDAVLSAVESRTSSPVRIPRGQSFESSISGLYPCGEGAGYAGGIVSAAMDGLKTAEALMARFMPPEG